MHFCTKYLLSFCLHFSYAKMFSVHFVNKMFQNVQHQLTGDIGKPIMTKARQYVLEFLEQ